MSTETNLKAPFPYFGGKSLAADAVWARLGTVKNYVEPFCGSAAVLLARPYSDKTTETVNDKDGMIANFWRAVKHDPEAVAEHADWPCNEIDLYARHQWLVSNKEDIAEKLRKDPDWFDSKAAGWWVWGINLWIGDGWCSDHHKAGTKRPKVSRGRGINSKHKFDDRKEYIVSWLLLLQKRLREVNVLCGDWERVLTPVITVYEETLTGVFLDPPYTKAKMQYSAGGVGGPLADSVRKWCIENGNNPLFRIVLCGHDGEHDELLDYGWTKDYWKAKKGYAVTGEARNNTKSETLWVSPHCIKTSLF